MAKMKAVIISLQQMTFDTDFNGITDLRDHLLLLHETLFDSLKKLANSQAELNQQEVTRNKISSEFDLFTRKPGEVPVILCSKKKRRKGKKVKNIEFT